ncbi:MAG: methylated-DNA--[protein]-cysteine S-methyltransferase [Bifidobacteriaceae bacterium]|jgi:methylated-DNA-[protein]-cysteine S-methyltransferase|nr:methylated-DNA--[protein]-cysteine S-methyltransferase [Bifidobacteriaceae bacterium]
MTTCKTYYDSPLGRLLGTAGEDGVTGLWFVGQRYFPQADELPVGDAQPELLRLGEWLDAYWRGERPQLAFRLAPAGADFRQAVWQLLLGIPHGQTTTYGALARQLADRWSRRVSARAVGGAVGHNPVSIVIPCHRVVGASGSLTGYAGGIGTKTRLLELEGVDMSTLFVPTSGTAL